MAHLLDPGECKGIASERSQETWSGAAEARSAAGRAPLRDVAVDLLGVVMDMAGVDPEPVLGGVVSGLGVAAPATPRVVAEPGEQCRRAGPHRVHHRERGVERVV